MANCTNDGSDAQERHLFAVSADEPLADSLLWHGWTDGWRAYAAGYKQAADLLATYVETEGRGRDTLLYPVLFLYRHYMEVSLKSLRRRLQLLKDQEGEFRKTHKLGGLWAECRTALSDVFQGAVSEAVETVGLAVVDMELHDPKSEAFRYPQDATGEATLTGLKRINLSHMRDRMSEVATAVDFIEQLVVRELNGKVQAGHLRIARWREIESEMLAAYEADCGWTGPDECDRDA